MFSQRSSVRNHRSWRSALRCHSEACVGGPKNLSSFDLPAALETHSPSVLSESRLRTAPLKANVIKINTYEKMSRNSFAINTYKNIRLKVEQNQHLQNTRGDG